MTQVISVRTAELTASDLDNYSKAVEKALLNFHTSRMAEINATVKELWQKTYQGNDIDYIALKADGEGTGTRSYNYRYGSTRPNWHAIELHGAG